MKFFTFIFISIILIFNFNSCGRDNIKYSHTKTLTSDDAILQTAFEDKQSNLQVHDIGKVVKLLADDTTGSQHQRFILKLASGQTILIVHNIDIATRIDTLMKNDNVEFYGEYVWNSKGGLVHWTHHDPQHEHTDGWLKHQNITYD